MENIDKVAGHIQRKHPKKTSLHFHHTDEGKNYFFEGKHFWRLFNFISSDTYSRRHCGDFTGFCPVCGSETLNFLEGYVQALLGIYLEISIHKKTEI